MATIYCDEAGNTGENLLDLEQPTFVLASNNYSTTEATALLSHVISPQGAEPKFSALKRTAAGRQRLANFLADPRLNETRVATYPIHKKYLVYTKMVDLVVEPMMHEDEVDLYERGGNIAYSNVLFMTTSITCGEELTDRMLDAFVKMIRYRTPEHIEKYFEIGEALLNNCNLEKAHDMLFPFFARVLKDRWFPSVPMLLEPAIPALFQHVIEWGRRMPGRFNVLHDKSKPVLATQEDFEHMLAGDGERSSKIGYDRRKYEFPLRATSLEQADSVEHPQIQVADICAGATAHLMRQRLLNQPDELSEMIDKLGCIKWAIGCIWPSADVTPQQLGTDGGGDVPALDPLIERFMRGVS